MPDRQRLAAAAINRMVFANRSGKFTLRGLPPGEYRIAAAPKGLWFVTDWLTVGNSTTSISLRLPEGKSIEGVVRGPEGRPFAGADVRFTLNKIDRVAASFCISSFCAQSDGTGRFALRGVPDGVEFGLGAVAWLGRKKLASVWTSASAGTKDLELDLAER
jgi:hypothetical protein